MDISALLAKISTAVINPLILLVFSIALIVFLYGIMQFVRSETSDKTREEGKKKILYGLLGMFIMFSAYGLIRIILDTFGISHSTGYITF